MDRVTFLLTACTALSAVTIVPLVSFFVTRIQAAAQTKSAKEQIQAQTLIANQEIQAQVVANNRQAWINSLRDEIAGFIEWASKAHLFFSSHKDSVDAVFSYQLVGEGDRHLAKIQLMINPQEADHKELVNCVKEFRRLAGSDATTGAFHDALDQLVATAQPILKREWERVKSLD